MEQWVKITLKEYKELLEVLGEYKLHSYAYNQMQPEQVQEHAIIGFNMEGVEEDEELDDKHKQLIKS